MVKIAKSWHGITTDMIHAVIPDASSRAISRNFPRIADALGLVGLDDLEMFWIAIAKLYSETNSFALGKLGARARTSPSNKIRVTIPNFETTAKPGSPERLPPALELAVNLKDKEKIIRDALAENDAARVAEVVISPGRSQVQAEKIRIFTDLLERGSNMAAAATPGDHAKTDRDIPASALDEVDEGYKADGPWVELTAQGDGTYTVSATFSSDDQQYERELTPEKADRQPKEPRYVNLWIDDPAKPPPLEVGSTYKLGLNIGKKRSGALNSTEFSEPEWKDTDAISLTVIVTGNGVRISPQLRRFDLYPAGDTETVYFDIVPTRREDFLLRISIYLTREMGLLQEFECPVEMLDAASAA
jgi:hypothetical protein